MLAAAEQAWPPFVLVTGLLLIGTVAGSDGLFEAVGARLARAPLSPQALLMAGLVLVLPNAALPVVAIGLAATGIRRLRPRLDARALGLLFALTVALGTLARVWHGAAKLLDSQGRWASAGIAALASVLVNNLPASVLLSAQPPLHPRALLLGLDLGPNLAVTGSLSALLWLQAARRVGADASTATYSKLGLMLVPLTVAGALAALRL